MREFLSKFLYLTEKNHGRIIWLFCLFLLVAFLEFLGVGMVGPFIAVVTNPELIQQNYWLSLIYKYFDFKTNNQFLILLGFFILVVFYTKSFLSFSSQKSVFEFGFKFQADLMSRLLNLYLRAPYTFHLTKNTASIIKTVTHETSAFCSDFMMPLLTSASNSIIIVALLILLIKTDALAMIIILIIAGVSFIVFHFLKDRLATWGKSFSESHVEIIRAINHGLGGLKEVKVIGCESYFENEMRLAGQKFFHSASRALGFGNLPRYLIEAFLMTFLIIFAIAYININSGSKDGLTAVLGIFALASIRLLPAVGNLLSSISTIRYKLYSLDSLYLELTELNYLNHSDQNAVFSKNDSSYLTDSPKNNCIFETEVTLNKVTYTYPKATKPSLNEISLTLKKGESIGIIGKSGAGKTTLVDVLLGLLKPQGGDIVVDGKSIYSSLRSWQDLVGYVPQSIFLIDDSLEKNIAFGVTEQLIDKARLDKAIQASQLSDLVEQLPNGIKTVIGERGILLSGGQRQRIGIARALYYEREILVFDEATAALDNETEALITESIRSLSGLKTVIIIAHRLSTIEHCDCVYQIDRGKVVRAGTYREVVLNQPEVGLQ